MPRRVNTTSFTVISLHRPVLLNHRARSFNHSQMCKCRYFSGLIVAEQMLIYR